MTSRLGGFSRGASQPRMPLASGFAGMAARWSAARRDSSPGNREAGSSTRSRSTQTAAHFVAPDNNVPDNTVLREAGRDVTPTPDADAAPEAAPPTLGAPTFTPGGRSHDPGTVTINPPSDSDGGSIYFTTDGGPRPRRARARAPSSTSVRFRSAWTEPRHRGRYRAWLRELRAGARDLHVSLRRRQRDRSGVLAWFPRGTADDFPGQPSRPARARRFATRRTVPHAACDAPAPRARLQQHQYIAVTVGSDLAPRSDLPGPAVLGGCQQPGTRCRGIAMRAWGTVRRVANRRSRAGRRLTGKSFGCPPWEPGENTGSVTLPPFRSGENCVRSRAPPRIRVARRGSDAMTWFRPTP